MKKIVTQLRHEEFQCPAPSSENGPPLPDLGAFKAGLLSTASVLVTANDGAPPGVVALNVLPRQGVVRPDKDSLVAADCKFPTFTQTATRFTPLQRIACPKGSTKNSNPQYVAGTFCAVGFMPPE